MQREALTASDLAALEKCFITPELAEEAGLFRVDSPSGAQIVGRNGSGDYSGIVIPYYRPGEDSPREYRLRRDHPDLEEQPDGTIKQKGKYLSPPGKSNMLYFAPGVNAEWLNDASLTILITEGEKKTLALMRLAWHEVERDLPRFLPVGLGGAWNWLGVVGKAFDENGSRCPVKGVISDFDRIAWNGRIVYVIFDENVATNESVRGARQALAKELIRRGAKVRLVDLPLIKGLNGVDELLHAKGPEYVLGLIDGSRPTEAKSGHKSQSTKLVELATDVELFHTPDGEAYASFDVDGHLETWSVKSRGFRDWLTRRLYKTEHKAPAAQSLQDALNVLSSRARFDGQTHEVHIRIAQEDGAIYVDLVDDMWTVIKVTAEGWRALRSGDCPVRFRRTKGMLPLPQPIPSTDTEALRHFLNVTDDQWPLAAGWLVACYRPGKPFPLLALHGEQGSAKSTTARILRALIDPNKAPLRSQPRDERDLMIAATNGWVVALDNLSRIHPSLSDALCRLATGTGFGTRKLYENDEEVLFDAMRPILLNGIEELATRSDLLDRTLVLTLPAIPDYKRRTEAELWSAFEEKRPAIFGALLNAVSCALRNESNVHLDHLPRMADFAQWAVAAEPALGLTEGEFMRAYMGNRESTNDLALESSPASTLVTALVDDCGRWVGTASELLAELNSRATEEVRKQYGWPKSPQALGGVLKRLAPNLRAVGINIEKGTGRQRRTWTLEKSGNSSSPSSPLSPDVLLSEIQGDKDGTRDHTLTRDLSLTKGSADGVGDDGDDGDNQIQVSSEVATQPVEIAERAAILEYDGGLEREEALRIAQQTL